MIASSTEHLWTLIHSDHKKWNNKAHQEDQISINEYITEYSNQSIYGYTVTENKQGELTPSKD